MLIETGRAHPRHHKGMMMLSTTTIKPGHKSLKAYYEALAAYGTQNVAHELALRSAFQNLLAETAKPQGWTLVPELESKAAGQRIRPDGTLRDANGLPRGYWEAKDTHDDLAAEMARKVAKGYPLINTIFEDTRRAFLYQDGARRMDADLTQPQQLADLLNRFLAHTEPNIAEFEEAVEEFKERVPELARGLAGKIAEAHGNNAKFQAAFTDFYTLCQASLNPNISRGAVDEMLVQHLLTERLMRRIFENEDFTRKNAIAAEIEKVIDALTSHSFSRGAFLKSLDRFYVAIEGAARTLSDFGEKQHFLNTIYERFFQGYSVKTADTHGIVYTPQPIVDFMCASVVEVLKEEFGKSLGDAGVNVIDPCTGTGNFIVNMLKRVPKRNLVRTYRDQFFANEIMLLPYYIAALNIEHTYYELTDQYEAFEGLCFVDTLDIFESHQTDLLNIISEKNTQRVKRQQKTPITIIIGNPPYNANQQDENDNNKNQKYKILDKHIKVTYSQDSKATNKNRLSDPYIKFFRWATDRLGDRDGIVCFVSNNSFIDQVTFDGMRKHLFYDFTQIYHIDLNGNVRKNPKLSGTIHNVFGIQVGVGITLAIRKASIQKKTISYHKLPEFWRKEEKLNWLVEKKNVKEIEWQNLVPDKNSNWIVPRNADIYEAFMPMGTKFSKDHDGFNFDSIFKRYSGGIKSNRDDVVYDLNRQILIERIKKFILEYNSEIDRFKRAKDVDNIDDFVDYAKINWSLDLKLKLQRGKYIEFSENCIRSAIYRPFTKKTLYFSNVLNDRVYNINKFIPIPLNELENRLICVTNEPQIPFSAIMANVIPCLHVGGRQGQCFPFYVYDEDGTNRRENITDWALGEFRKFYQDTKISKWDIFYYVYGVLHHPGYREKFADNLKRELPRIPHAPDFAAFAAAGKELAALHLDYETLEPWPLDFAETPGVPYSVRVDDKMRLGKDKTTLRVNESLTLAGIPAEAFEYRLGNRSALEWVIDQYQVKDDARTGIHSDPNREEDPEYIVRLVGQVARVSMETVRIVKGLPKEYAGENLAD